MRAAIFSILFFTGISRVFPQASDSSGYSFRQAESELKVIQKKLDSKKENERLEGNREFVKLWTEVLSHPQSMQYPFDSITGASRLMSGDKKFRIITWNVYKNDGTYGYFGFIQVNNKKVQKKGLFKKTVTYEYEVFPLSDKSAAVKSPESYVGDPTKWFGMLYTAIEDCDGYYTLLGWDGNDKLTQRKFVDVLYFKPDGTPIFGKDVFKIPKKSPKRLMFEYSSEITMSLRFDKTSRIVFSHLSPKNDFLEGQYQYYGPDGSFDALEQAKDRWVLQEDIDARNPKNKNDDRKKENGKGKVMPKKK
ncbi:MAG: hypothetical protein ACXVP0_14505 [Bacteroidia bacterium]